MKIVYIGTVEFSRVALKKLISMKADVVGVLTQKDSHLNADFADLSELCVQNNIAFKDVIDINADENVRWVQDKCPDIIFCFGFSQLLKERLLNIAPQGVLGYHPAELPQNRGRHPIIWALALGLEQTTSTFFFMDKGADSGDIVSQKKIVIEYRDDARTLYNKVIETAIYQIECFLPELQNKSCCRSRQDSAAATNWRKRTKADGRIDFRMTSRAIYNLVRALTRPYVGAHVLYQEKEVKIWRVVEKECAKKNVEHGKVLDVVDGQILVKCYDGAVLLVAHEFLTLPCLGEYLL